MNLKIDDLVCPCEKRYGLMKIDNRLFCTDRSCAYSVSNKGFSSIDSIPIIVNEERCDTIVDRNKIGKLVKRKKQNKLMTSLKKLLASGTVTRRNIERFKSSLPKAQDKKKILVVGSGKPGNDTLDLWLDPTMDIVGFDVYSSETTHLIADAHYMPFRDGSFQGVVIQAVLEHVIEPEKVVREIHRVLAKDGVVYSEIPFMQQVHEGAFDITRFTLVGHIALFKRFEPIDFGGNKSSNVALAWSVRYFILALTGSKLVSKVFGVVAGLLLAPFTKLMTKQAQFDSASGTYLLGRKADKSLSHRQIVNYYGGVG